MRGDCGSGVVHTCLSAPRAEAAEVIALSIAAAGVLQGTKIHNLGFAG